MWSKMYASRTIAPQDPSFGRVAAANLKPLDSPEAHKAAITLPFHTVFRISESKTPRALS